MYTRLLTLILLVAAIGWGIALVGVILPWPLATAGLTSLGAGDIPPDPMLNYWLRMAGGGFSIIGILFAAILIKPKTYGVLIPLMAWLSIGEGIILLISGLRLRLGPFPFAGDVGFCLAVGIGLLVVHPKASKEQQAAPPPQ